MRLIKRATRPFLIGSALMALSVVSVAAQSQNEIPRGDGEQVSRPAAASEAIAALKSPYCPTMLEVCSSLTGAALRDSIVDLAEQGWTADQIIEWVVGNHGEAVRALPKRSGKSLIAWIVPPLGVALGVLALVMALRGMIRPSGTPTVTAEGISDEQEERLRQAMQELDREEEATFF